MPFGAELQPGGGVRFRLWAPAARNIDVVLANRSFEMTKLEDGWYEHFSPDARAGTL